MVNMDKAGPEPVQEWGSRLSLSLYLILWGREDIARGQMESDLPTVSFLPSIARDRVSFTLSSPILHLEKQSPSPLLSTLTLFLCI